jgi:hypothetical protein
MVRDVEFAEVTMRSLRDIVGVGDSPTVYNFLTLSGTGALSFGDIPVSVVSPSLLIRELQLQKSESTEQPPLMPHPLFAARPAGG